METIRQFYERPEGRGLAEALMDLEEDDVLRVQVIRVLEASVESDPFRLLPVTVDGCVDELNDLILKPLWS